MRSTLYSSLTLYDRYWGKTNHVVLRYVNYCPVYDKPNPLEGLVAPMDSQGSAWHSPSMDPHNHTSMSGLISTGVQSPSQPANDLGADTLQRDGHQAVITDYVWLGAPPSYSDCQRIRLHWQFRYELRAVLHLSEADVGCNKHASARCHKHRRDTWLKTVPDIEHLYLWLASLMAWDQWVPTRWYYEQFIVLTARADRSLSFPDSMLSPPLSRIMEQEYNVRSSVSGW